MSTSYGLQSLTKLAIFSTSTKLNRMLPLTGGEVRKTARVNPNEERERSLLQGDSIETQWEIKVEGKQDNARRERSVFWRETGLTILGGSGPTTIELKNPQVKSSAVGADKPPELALWERHTAEGAPQWNADTSR